VRTLVESFIHDLAYALRGFRRAPAPFLIAAGTMALGAGATTAVFTMVDSMLFRALPYAQPERLVWIGMKAPIYSAEFLLEGDYWRFQQHAQVFESLTNLTGAGDCDLNEQDPLKLTCVEVAANFLPTLGIRPIAGRNFTAAETVPNGPRAVLLAYGLWQRRFGGGGGVLGRTLMLDGRPAQVIGVLPPDFELPTLARVDIVRGEQVNLGATVTRTPLLPFGRLRPGVSVEQARAQLEPIYRECAKFIPAGFAKDVSFHVTPMRERQVREYRAASLALLGAVIGVLLIACANIAGLLLARAAVRRHEFAVRAAIGAGRGRLARQMLTESLLLALIGGTAGVLLGAAMLRLLVALAPARIPHLQDAALDLRVLLFALAASVVCGLLFGLAPALRTPRAETLNLARIAGGGLRLRQTMVAAQIALTFVLLSSALLLGESLRNLERVQLGMRPEKLLTVRVQLGRQRYPGPPQQTAFFAQVAEGLSRLPGIRALAFTDSVPLYGSSATSIFSNILIEGRPLDPKRATGGMVVYREVSPEYFPALGIPIVRGRGFSERDRSSSEQVVIISESLVRRLFPHEDAIGRRLEGGIGGFHTIIGIARDVKNAGLSEGDDPEYYYLWRQEPRRPIQRAHILLRTDAEPVALARLVRAEIGSIDPTLPLTITTMEQNLGRYVEYPRFETVLFSLFALVAILLGAVGQFGAISSMVSERTAEIGVRMALGATGRDVAGLVLRHTLAWTLAGSTAGIAGACLGARWLEALLFGVKARDAASYAAALALLISVSLLAVWRPVRRAAAVDPARILRHE
jgi:predicted permease